MPLEIDVTLEDIVFESGIDEFFGVPSGVNNYEVRGTLGVYVSNHPDSGPIQNRVQYTLFRRADNQAEVTEPGNPFAIQVSRTVFVFSDEILRLGGHLKEDDDLSSDDDFGEVIRWLDFEQLQNIGPEGRRVNIPYHAEGQGISVNYLVRKIREVL